MRGPNTAGGQVMNTPALGMLIRSFFEDYLICQKGLSAATIKSYRDGLRLFLGYLAEDRGCRITRLTITDLTAKQVTAFLNEIERKRTNHIRTPNQRLAGLRCFFSYLASRDRVLILFLYNTGARVQETADLRTANLELSAAPRVHLHGKGDKWRVCPLWKETSQLPVS